MKAMRASLRAPRGQYEAKALLGLAHAWQPLSPATGTSSTRPCATWPTR